MSVMWNCWHGCTKLSAGCLNCYMYRRDALYGKDSTVAAKTGAFRLPVKKDRQGRYKIPSGELVYTCCKQVAQTGTNNTECKVKYRAHYHYK